MLSIQSVTRLSLNTLLPHHCPFCENKSQNYLCDECFSRFKLNTYRCTQCALPLNHTRSAICGECLKSPPAFDMCIAPFVYNAEFGSALAEFKRKGKLRCGRQLCEPLTTEVLKTYSEQTIDYLVPIPMHWRAQLKRGFNQADELAKALSYSLSIPIKRALVKTKSTSDQKQLGKLARQKNLHQSIQTKRIKSPIGHIALIDDVMTTGATANLCAKAMKNFGASRVDVWTLARTPAINVEAFYTKTSPK